MTRTRSIPFLAMFMLLFAVSVHAQSSLGTGTGAENSVSARQPHPETALQPQPDTFGTSSVNYDWVSMEDFQPFAEGSGYFKTTGDFYWSRNAVTGQPYLGGYLRLDSGVQVNSIRFFYRDTNASAQPTFYICVHKVSNVGALVGNDCSLAATPTTVNPGYTFFDITPLAAMNPYTRVDAGGNSVRWLLVAQINVGDNTIEFGGARAAWQRIVSPGPATNTFGDVLTTHPFFKFIEALYASGITAGCGSGNFCPDANVTRGQMAVFLAAGLGLHFAP